MLGLRDKTLARKIGATMSAIAAAAGLVLAGAPAATAAPASYPTQHFGVGFDLSDYSGTLTWYNRSVGLVGTFKAVGCRRVYAAAWAGSTRLDYRSSSTHCDSTAPAPITLNADKPGGAGMVDIWMTDAYGNILDEEVLFRP